MSIGPAQARAGHGMGNGPREDAGRLARGIRIFTIRAKMLRYLALIPEKSMDQHDSLRQRPRRVTLKAVAEAAKVSPITVSNVVNGRFHSMSAETRMRVEAAIAQLNYRVNLAARGLKHSQHYCVALVVLDHRPAFLSHPAHHQVAAGLSNFLSANGYTVAIEGVSPERIENLSYLDRFSTDALCLIASGPLPGRFQVLEKLQAARQPLVVFHESPRNPDARTCYVRSDDRTGGELLARHMLEQGARRFVMLLPRREWAPMTERENGVKAALERLDGTSLHTLRVDGLSVQEIGATLEEYLKQNDLPEAVLGGNDLLAAAALKHLRRKGCRIPDQVRIGGFGCYDLIQYLDPTLSSIRIPTYTMGQTAGKEILHALSEGQFSRNDILLPVELVRGESS